MIYRRLTIPIAILWVLALAYGFKAIGNYETTPGLSAAAPSHSVFATLPQYRSDLPVLLIFAHPKCPCTRATIGNLDSLMTQAHGQLNAYVVFVRLGPEPAGWEKTDLWQSAASIPGVHAVSDPGGVLAHRFGIWTSGQTLLYGVNGNLLFNGGLTSERGHYGDNAGAQTILASLRNPPAHVVKTPVFGCSIFGDQTPPAKKQNERSFQNNIQ
jgi:hypothetical protein